MKINFGVIVAIFALAFAPLLASAHVTVKPAQVGVAAYQTFTVGVPNEKDVPTIAVRLVVPPGLHHVIPTVKPGWKVTVKEEKTGNQIATDEGGMEDETRVTEISWTGGSVPVGQRDEFTFSAQVHDTPTTLPWKAYQTYQGGTVVAWDQESLGGHDAVYPENTGPYSKTAVIDDLASDEHGDGHGKKMNTSSGISIVALVISLAALAKSRKVQQ